MIYYIIGIVVLIADILTKRAAVNNLMDISSIPIIDGVFHLTYVENSGVAFGMLRDKRIVFVTMSVIILVVLGIYFYKTCSRDAWLKLGTALIFSGSIGNMIERITKGFVVDFLDFRLINFPVFNIADMAVCIGAAALVVHFLFFADDGKNTENEKTNEINLTEPESNRKISNQ